MDAQRLISADSHVNEPSDLWQTRLDSKFRDRAPYITRNEKGKGFLFVVPGVLVTQIAGGFAAGKSGHELREHMSKGYEAARPGGWDPAERIKDQEIDGVQAEVIYTTLGARLFGLQDAEFQCACFRAFNGWLAEFCSYDPRRLAGIGLIPLGDIGEAIKKSWNIAPNQVCAASPSGLQHPRTGLSAAKFTNLSGKPLPKRASRSRSILRPAQPSSPASARPKRSPPRGTSTRCTRCRARFARWFTQG